MLMKPGEVMLRREVGRGDSPVTVMVAACKKGPRTEWCVCVCVCARASVVCGRGMYDSSEPLLGSMHAGEAPQGLCYAG